eukprot:10344-Heterococcus_DN1.PRE.3
MICIGNQSCHNLNTHFPVVQTPFSEREREREIDRARAREREREWGRPRSERVLVSLFQELVVPLLVSYSPRVQEFHGNSSLKVLTRNDESTSVSTTYGARLQCCSIT